VAPNDAARAADVLRAAGEAPLLIGRVVAVPLARSFEDRVEWPE
jgi:hypothetical protein